MKKMILKDVTVLCLFLFGGTLLNGQNHCIEIEKNLFCLSVNENNFIDVQGEIENYYANGHYWELEFDVVNNAIVNLLNDMDSTDENENCDPGGIELTDKIENGDGQEKIYKMLFRWTESELPINSTIYYAKYLNLLNVFDSGETSYDPSGDLHTPSPGVMLEVPMTYQKKLYVLYTKCGENVTSDYFIIIIDRDITLKNGFLGTRSDSTSEEKSKSHLESLSLEVFPNPVLDNYIGLKFNLLEDQETSIQLIEGGTGKQLKMLMPEQALKKGTYFEKVSLNGLVPGIYYVVLQTEGSRVIQKVIKS